VGALNLIIYVLVAILIIAFLVWLIRFFLGGPRV
jgi:hypothetical protein